jgi:NACalpha-BTF3-like transcription factor
MVKRIRVKSYLRKVKGRKRRVRVKAYTRRKPKKTKKRKIKPEPEEEPEEEEEEEESPEITEEDIDHWIESKNFADRSKTIKALIEAHGSQNAFYRALQDWAKHREI